MRPLALSLLAFAVLPGCEEILALQPPTGSLNRVDLVKSPQLLDLLAFECPSALGSAACGLALGPSPPEQDLVFSFDLVFDLHNPNAGVPIPLVDLLLATSVYGDTNLGAVCMSFCDPGDEDCVPTQDAPGACDAENSQQVEEPADLIPTVPELLALSTDLADGALDNADWRVLAGGESTEAHFQFDLQPDTMLSLSSNILDDAIGDFVADRNVRVDIPYSVNGTLFFDVPDLGRHGLSFGPFDDTWLLKLE